MIAGLVDRHVQRLAHARIVERLLLGVVGVIADIEPLLAHQVDRRVLLHRRDVGRIGVGHHLALARLELLIADRRVGGDREHQIVERRLAAPIVGVGLVADHRVLLVVDQLERPGADRLQIQLLGRARLHHLLGILRRHDRGEVHGEIGDERRLWRAQGELDRVVVDLLDGLQQVAHVHAGEVFVGAARDLVEGMVRVELPHEREHDIVGVEVTRRA